MSSALTVMNKLNVAITARQTQVENRLNSIGTALEPMTPAEAMQLSYDNANFHLVAQLSAGILKDMLDTHKAIANKS